MKPTRIALLVSLSLLATPSIVHAHLVTTGLGPFYDGALHLAFSPDDLLSLLAAAMLAGLCGAQAGRWTLAALPTAWLVGAGAGLVLQPSFAATPGLSIISLVVLGLLVAFDARLPAWAVATISRAVTLPSRWRRSQFITCGGVKPMTPTLIGWVSPAPSVSSRSRIT